VVSLNKYKSVIFSPTVKDIWLSIESLNVLIPLYSNRYSVYTVSFDENLGLFGGVILESNVIIYFVSINKTI